MCPPFKCGPKWLFKSSLFHSFICRFIYLFTSLLYKHLLYTRLWEVYQTQEHLCPQGVHRVWERAFQICWRDDYHTMYPLKVREIPRRWHSGWAAGMSRSPWATKERGHFRQKEGMCMVIAPEAVIFRVPWRAFRWEAAGVQGVRQESG